MNLGALRHVVLFAATGALSFSVPSVSLAGQPPQEDWESPYDHLGCLQAARDFAGLYAEPGSPTWQTIAQNFIRTRCVGEDNGGYEPGVGGGTSVPCGAAAEGCGFPYPSRIPSSD